MTYNVFGGMLNSEWNTERVREDASGDSEDDEDDELPCVIGESAGDCVWRGSRRSVGSLFYRQGAAYRKEQLVIFKEDRVGGRARVTIDEERVLWQGWTEIKSWRYWGCIIWFLQQTVSHFGRFHNVWHRARRGSKEQEKEEILRLVCCKNLIS